MCVLRTDTYRAAHSRFVHPTCSLLLLHAIISNLRSIDIPNVPFMAVLQYIKIGRSVRRAIGLTAFLQASWCKMTRCSLDVCVKRTFPFGNFRRDDAQGPRRYSKGGVENNEHVLPSAFSPTGSRTNLPPFLCVKFVPDSVRFTIHDPTRANHPISDRSEVNTRQQLRQPASHADSSVLSNFQSKPTRHTPSTFRPSNLLELACIRHVTHPVHL
jgi:hypothetical protein